jgi:predicted HicB family RNase H-like nuclease
MWQQLVEEVGVVWIILVLLLSAGVLVFTGLLWWLLRGVTGSLIHRLHGLRQDIETLPGNRIENLKQVQVIVGDRGGPDMKIALEQIADDSKTHFEGFWTPDPAERLNWTMLLGVRSAWLMQPSIVTLPFLAAVLVTFLAFVTALAISGTSFANDWMRFLALLPLIIGGLSILALQQSKKTKSDAVLGEWTAFMVHLKRKIPVYSQAAETAALLKSFVNYDHQMTRAAKQLSDRVEALASGELTESITGAVKYVMAASVAPPIQKSTDSLNLLTQQLEKKLVAGENQLMRLYTELESRQQQQAELWIRRYQEITQTLTGQQKHSLQQLVSANQTNWQDLNENLTSLISDLSQGQKTLQADLLTDQKQSLEAIRSESHEVISQMQTQYTTTLSDQSRNQSDALDVIQKKVLESVQLINETVTRLTEDLHASQQETLTRLNENQAALLTALDEHQSSALETMDGHLVSTLQEMSGFQGAALEALQENQSQSLHEISESQKTSLQEISERQKTSLQEISESQMASLQEISESQIASLRSLSDTQKASLQELSITQKASLQEVSDSQKALLKEISEQQAATLQTISNNQGEALSGFLGNQITALDAIRQSQQDVLEGISQRLESGLAQIDTAQQAAYRLFSKTHLDAVNSLARQQSEGVHDLLSQFSGQVSDILSEYLSPVSTRLQDSAEALIAAQIYAHDVQEALALQKEQSRVLEESIRDVLVQFVETRENMMGDINSMEQSTRIMGESAATMSAIYSGSQTGLNDSITRMSDDMLSLSEALQSVLKGSAEQTKQLQEQANATYEINQQHLDAVGGQIDILTNDLATRIDQLMIGFSQLTENLIHNVQNTIDNQNDQLGSGLKALTEIMADEARSISLYAQQINMDINQLSGTLGEAVTGFSSGIQLELTSVLSRFDAETADILRRLSVAASEIGDAVENLPDVIHSRSGKADMPKNPNP